MVTLSDTIPGANISVTAYRYNGQTWEGLGSANTTSSGAYLIGGLLPGAYRLYFADNTRAYKPEYYNNVAAIISATDIAVITDTVTSNINAVLDLPAPPAAQVSTSGGSVTYDPNTGEATIMTTSGGRADTTITRQVVCASGTPANVTLWLGIQSYSMTENPAGSGSFQATIPANDITSGELFVRWTCSGAAQEKRLGEIVLYDPSGIITDASTGTPITGATVSLYKVNNWLPDTLAERRNCRTTETRAGGVNGDWSQESAATSGLGVLVNPSLNATQEISPTVNPLVTDGAGYYGWDVAEGCWYVSVQATGYDTRLSPVVGVPPVVTDLDLALTPTVYPIYLPLIKK